MFSSISHAALAACVFGAAVSAQAPQSSDANQQASSQIRLRFASFDPLANLPEVPAALRSTAQQQLWIAQFNGTPTQADRDAIAESGGKRIGYLPDNCYVVRMNAAQAETLRSTARWVGAYHPAFRLDPALIADGTVGEAAPVRYNIVVADKHTDKPALMQQIGELGGRVDSEEVGSVLIEATLTGQQLAQVLRLDEVLWIDRWSPDEFDMDNARIQGGGNYVEAQAGYTGQGVNTHIYEGVEATHPDFTGGVVNVRSGGAAATHGHATAGIVFGNGNSNPAVRGMAPDAGKFYTNNGSVNGSRWQVFSDLVNIHNVSHTTASWGGARTFFYTSTSMESDDIVFDHNLSWTQSQSNAGNQDSRPQAWAKNVFSIGGVNHANDSNPLNDSWQNGSASIGPASDGRIKPTLCAYYDNIGTSDRTGSAGYSSGSWTAGFGGTSGATPIVAGHNTIAIQMYTDEVTPGFGQFGNQLRVPGGTAHQNRPHFTTLKGLQVVNANQYAFTGASADNRREHQGWGFPNIQNMWDNRDKTFIVDEIDVLQQGQTRSWDIDVAAGEPSLKACLTWNEPGANPSSASHLINNLSLRLTSPGGVVYWGNNNLENGVWSTPGGSQDNVNSIECVFVQNPQAGTWTVDVLATSIVEDNHVETPGVDADYGLVVRGGEGEIPEFATFGTYGDGCPGTPSLPVVCPDLNPTGGALGLDLRDNEYCYRVDNTGPLTVLSFDIWNSSTGGTVNVPAHIYGSTGSAPTANPIASTTITIGPSQQFWTATFASPVNVSGTFYIGVDSSAQTVYVNTLTAGTDGVGFWRDAASPAWSQSVLVEHPSWRVNCTGTATPLSPELSNSGLPVLGSSYSVTLADALDTAFAVMASGTSDTTWSGGSLPAPIPGAPGCDLLVSPDVLAAALTSATGTASSPISVPNNSSLIGFELFHQWVVLDNANPAGLVFSNGGRAKVGN